MVKSNRRSNKKNDVTQIKASVCNVLIVTNENECKDSLLIKDKKAIKPKKNNQRVHNSNPKNTPKVEFHCDIAIEFHLTLSLEGFLAQTPPVYFFFFFVSHLIASLSLDESIVIVHPCRRRTQLTIFGINNCHFNFLK